MSDEMITERLCCMLNRMLESKYLDEVLAVLGDRCKEVGRDGNDVTNPANWYAVDDFHAIVYLRRFDEFVPLNRTGGVPESIWCSYRRLRIV